MKISIANLFFLLLAIAVAFGWYVDHQRSQILIGEHEEKIRDLYELIRTAKVNSAIYENSAARSKSSRVELEHYANLRGSEFVDCFLDAHRRHLQATIAMKDSELKLTKFDDLSAAESKLKEFRNLQYMDAVEELQAYLVRNGDELNATSRNQIVAALASYQQYLSAK